MPSMSGSRFTQFAAKKWYPAWWLKHEFELDAAAPLGSPYTGNGVGALVIVDTNSKLSNLGGKALFATGGSASGNPAMYGAQQTRATGRALFGVLSQTAQNFEFGWNSAQSGTNLLDCIRFNSTGSAIRDNGTAIDVALQPGGGPYTFILIQRTAGFWAYIKGVGIPSYKLIWVGVGSSGNHYPGAIVASTTYVGNVDTMRGCDLGFPFTDDYGPSSQRLAGARSAADAISHEADFFAEWTQTTLPTVGNTDIRFRVVDANNYIQALVSTTGALTLNTVTAGTPTQIGTSAAAVAAGNRVVISMDGSTIRSYVNSVVKAIGTSTSFTTQLNGTISALGTTGAVSDLITWPIYANSGIIQMFNAAVMS